MIISRQADMVFKEDHDDGEVQMQNKRNNLGLNKYSRKMHQHPIDG